KPGGRYVLVQAFSCRMSAVDPDLHRHHDRRARMESAAGLLRRYGGHGLAGAVQFRLLRLPAAVRALDSVAQRLHSWRMFAWLDCGIWRHAVPVDLPADPQ